MATTNDVTGDKIKSGVNSDNYRNNFDDIFNKAKEEVEEESFREKVEAEKERIRNKRPLLHRLFPWKITITRR